MPKCGRVMRNIPLSQLSVIVLAALCVSLQSAQAQQPTRGVVDASRTRPVATGLGSYEALVIGNNDYRFLGKLQTAINDADAVAKVLHDRYGFKTRILHNATRDDIITAMVEYRRRLPDDSSLLIYYAGHGHLDREVDEAYWLPIDADRDNNENWISADDITRNVRAIHSLHVLIISDSCYSGTITRDANVSLLSRDKEKVIARMLRSKSRTLMASGGNEPVADSGGGAGHSVFAGALLQGLRDMQDGEFTADTLFEAIRPRVAGRSEQVPKYDYIRNSGHDDGDFVFSRLGAKSVVTGGRETGGGTEDADEGGGDSSIDSTVAGTRLGNDQPPAFDPQKEIDAIRDVLNLYKDAYEQRDASVLWKIWPGAPPKTKQTIEASFSTAAVIHMNLEMGPPNLGQDHASATVKGSFSQMYIPRKGTSQPYSGDIAFSLQKKDGMWAIVSVK